MRRPLRCDCVSSHSGRYALSPAKDCAYDILHPDLVLVGHRDLMIGFPGPKHPTIYDRVVRLALVHIVAIEEFLRRRRQR